MGKGASLKPSDMTTSGGRVPDGRYVVKTVTAEIFDYQGKSNEVPAAAVLFRSKTDGSEHEQMYSAGDLKYLVPNEAKDEFVHPDPRQDGKFSTGTNFGKLLASLVNAGFPEDELTPKVNCIAGVDVDIVAVAQPKNRDGKDNQPLPLVAKYYGKEKAQTGAKARPTSVPAAARTSAPTPASPSPAASNGDVDEQAREQVMAALAEADGNTLTRKRLYTVVMTSVAALKKDREGIPARPEVFANLVGITKAVNNPTWLAAQAEAGGWTVEGDNVKLG